jgi:tetratricopeptide (TPR) repeat protein
MGEILQFPAKQPSKFGFERVKKLRKENPDQLRLFPRTLGQILRLQTGMGPFDEALVLDEHNDKGAEEAYWRAISEGDRPADAYCNLGIIESKAGRTAKAFDCFTKSLEYDARHFESHYNLGNLYFDADNLRIARMHYELAAEIEPLFPNLYFNLGLVLALLDEKKAAIDAFVEYKRLAPRGECGKADSLIRELKRQLRIAKRREK